MLSRRLAVPALVAGLSGLSGLVPFGSGLGAAGLGAAGIGAAGLSGLVLPQSASAAGLRADPYALSPQDQARVAKATAYLQGLATVSGRFTQTDAQGHESRGTIYLQRPGKARFAYDPPADMTIVSDGSTVALWDGRLRSYQKAPLSRTPLNLLLAEHIRLDRGVDVGRVDTTGEGFAITAVDAHHRALGRIVIYFGEDPMALKGWNIIDGQGRTTRVRLGPLSARGGLDPALFVLSDPRKGR